MNQSKNSDNLHTCEGVAECPIDDSDTLQNVKSRVKELAKLSACKEIDNYIYLFLKNKNFMLPSEEISSISVEISNVIDVKYQLQNSDNDNMLIHASVIAQFDDNDILNHLDKFFREKSALVEQNEELRQKLAKLEMQQDRDSREKSALHTENEELKHQIAELKSQQDKNSREISTLKAQKSSLAAQNDELRNEIEVLKRQLANSQKNTPQVVSKDRIARANQKKDEAMKLFNKNVLDGAIKLFSEAIQLNPNVASFYLYRGRCYQELGNDLNANEDYSKYKELLS